MKVVITGHTKGIGQAIYNYFAAQGHDVVGFSRSTGHDISVAEQRNLIIRSAINADIFVNNATGHTNNAQFILLTSLYDFWQNQKNKIIINLSSVAANFCESYKFQQYAKLKKQQDVFCSTRFQGPWIINLKPGNVDTAMTFDRDDPEWPKMDVNAVVKIIHFALENKESFKLREATFLL